MNDFSVTSYTMGSGFRDFDIDEFINRDRHGSVEVIISSFDDLKEAFDRLLVGKNNLVFLSQIGIIDLIPLIEEVVISQGGTLDLTFVTYDNFITAKKNLINRNPVVEKIDHIMSFMISHKYEQMRVSLSSATQIVFAPELYVDAFDVNMSSGDIVALIQRNVSINLVRLGEYNQGD